MEKILSAVDKVLTFFEEWTLFITVLAAMVALFFNVILRYGFTEVNLKRVTLTVFEYNPRAIRSYEKAGFRHEGRMRGALNKEGKRWDILVMGILREEWMEQNGYKTTD